MKISNVYILYLYVYMQIHLIRSVDVVNWVRGSESLTFTIANRENIAIPILGLGLSIGTDGAPITADLIVLTSWDQLVRTTLVVVNDACCVEPSFYSKGKTKTKKWMWYYQKGESCGVCVCVGGEVARSLVLAPRCKIIQIKNDTPVPRISYVCTAVSRCALWLLKETFALPITLNICVTPHPHFPHLYHLPRFNGL